MVEFDGFVVHWYFSYNIKRATKLKLWDERTLSANLVSYTSGGSRGEHRGPVPPPPLTVNFPSSIIDLLVLEFYSIFNLFFHKKHTKIYSELRNFVEKKHFAARKQFKATNHGILEAWFIDLGVWPKFCARLSLCSPLPQLLDLPLYTDTVLSLLWPNKFALIFCSPQRELTNTKQWETLFGTLPQTVYRPQPQRTKLLHRYTEIYSSWWMCYFLWVSRGQKSAIFASWTFQDCSVEQRGFRNSILFRVETP